MITRCFLPESIRLPGGAILKPIIGGHLEQKPFLTLEHSGVDVTREGWGSKCLEIDPDWHRGERKLIIAEAKRQKLKYRLVGVLSRRLRGKCGLGGRPYQAYTWVFVEVK